MIDELSDIKDVVSNIYDKLSEEKKQISMNFIMTKSNERFPINPSILLKNGGFLGLHNLSVYNSVYNITEKNNKFSIADEKTELEKCKKKDKKNCKERKNSITVYLSEEIIIEPGAYEFENLKETIKQKTEGKVIISVNTKNMKVNMHNGRPVDFDVEDSIADVFGLERKIYEKGDHKSKNIIQISPFETVNLHCNCIEGYLQNGKPTDILYTFRLNVPVGYKINETPQHVMYKKVLDERIDYMDFSITDENGNEIDFNGEKLCFTLELKN